MINLVEKLRELNQCRLCFSTFSGQDDLRKHEIVEHSNDEVALSLTYFTMSDLVFQCDMCPQIPGFLTENGLIAHKRLQHRIQVKSKFSKCPHCDKVVKCTSMKQHLVIHTSEKNFE